MVDTVQKSMRPEMRPDDARARAARRAQEILSNFSEDIEGIDEFQIPEDVIRADGWVREWKRYSVLNAVDTTNISELLRSGWEFVPRSRHPELAAFGSKDEHIFRKGQVLMEIPEEVYSRMQERSRRAAKTLVESIHKKATGDALAKQFSGLDRRGAPNFVRSSVDTSIDSRAFGGGTAERRSIPN